MPADIFKFPPATPDPTPAQLADLAAWAVRAYIARRDPAERREPDYSTDIRDLISDLLHLCDEVGLCPEAEAEAAFDNYEAEVGPVTNGDDLLIEEAPEPEAHTPPARDVSKRPGYLASLAAGMDAHEASKRPGFKG